MSRHYATMHRDDIIVALHKVGLEMDTPDDLYVDLAHGFDYPGSCYFFQVWTGSDSPVVDAYYGVFGLGTRVDRGQMIEFWSSLKEAGVPEAGEPLAAVFSDLPY